MRMLPAQCNSVCHVLSLAVRLSPECGPFNLPEEDLVFLDSVVETVNLPQASQPAVANMLPNLPLMCEEGERRRVTVTASAEAKLNETIAAHVEHHKVHLLRALQDLFCNSVS